MIVVHVIQMKRWFGRRFGLHDIQCTPMRWRLWNAPAPTLKALVTNWCVIFKNYEIKKNDYHSTVSYPPGNEKRYPWEWKIIESFHETGHLDIRLSGWDVCSFPGGYLNDNNQQKTTSTKLMKLFPKLKTSVSQASPVSYFSRYPRFHRLEEAQDANAPLKGCRCSVACDATRKNHEDIMKISWSTPV